jgi:Rieske Fe-S protein
MKAPYHYVRGQVVDGVSYLIVGGEDHKVGAEPDAEGAFERLDAYLRARFGRTSAGTDLRWSGQIIEPADGLPYVGRSALASHVFVATGYGGNGMTSGTLAAMILADQIRGIDNAWSELLDATRVKPLASARAFVSENADFPKRFVGDRLRLASPARRDDLDRIPPGEGAVVSVAGEKLAVYRNNEGDLGALSPVCTHLGCYVHWNTAEKSWDCPCHGSRFDTTGHVLNGPATAPLESKPIPAPPAEAEVVRAAPVPLGKLLRRGRAAT